MKNNFQVLRFFLAPYNLLSIIASAYVVIFFCSHNVEDITLVMVFSNFILLAFISLLVVNILLTILDRFSLKGYAPQILMGFIVLLFSHYMKTPITHNNYIRDYFLAPLAEWSIHLPIIIYSCIFFLLGFLIGKRVREFSVLISLMMLPLFFQLITDGVARWTESEEKVSYPLGERLEKLKSFDFKRKKNVFFILLDSYTSPEGLRVLNSNQGKFFNQLGERNFHVHDSFYTNFQTTRYAIPSYLNMSLKNEGRLLYETPWSLRSRMIAGEAQVYKIFRKNGYRLNILLPNRYLLGNHLCSFDLCTPSVQWLNYFGIGLLEKIVWPNILMSLISITPKNTVPEQDPFVDILENIRSDKDQQHFTYLHFYWPNHVSEHRYGFCEEKKETEAYLERLKKTNQLVLEVLKMIEGADPQAMVILASDHGPTLFNKCAMDNILKTKEEVIERQGAFLAIKWGDDYQGQFNEEIKTSANLFRYVFSYLMDDESILKDRVPDDAFYEVGKEKIITQSLRDGQIILSGKAGL